MERLPMCRVCFTENVRMYIVVNRNLHELYEKLTNIPFVTEDSRPILACFFCYAKLKQCYRLLRQCLEAEELFAQRMNEDYEPNPLSNQDRLQLFSGGFIKSPIEYINIIESIALKKEIPAVCEGLDDVIEPKEEPQSDEATVVRKPKLDTRGTKEKDAIPAEQTTKDKSDSKAIEQISIGDECQTESIAVKEEIPAVCDGLEDIIESNEEYQSDELELENLDNNCLDVADIPPHYSESDSEDDKPLMQLITEVEDEEVSKKKRRVRDTRKATVARKPKLDTQRTKEKDATPAEQTKKDKSDSKVIRTIQKRKSKPGTYFKEPYKCNQRNYNRVKQDYKCDVCQRSFSARTSFTRHIRIHTGEKPYKCDLCQRSFNENSKLKNHIRTHTGERPYKCDLCQRSFIENSKLKNHIRTHTDLKPYKCDVCQRSYSTMFGLKKHIRTHTDLKPYKCDVCRHSFSLKCNLLIHIRTHTGEKPYKCDLCQRSFTQKSKLKIHIRTHTGEKPYKCDLCQRSFSARTNFIRHIRIHTGEKPYKCDVCQRSYSTMFGLKKHIRTHTVLKPYKCDVCQRSFIEKSKLIVHICTHTGEKPYKCDLCRRSFNEKSKLKIHIRTHTGEKPYKCDLCQRSFSARTNFIRHIRTHTGEKPYKCDVCQRSYSTMFGLKKHSYTHSFKTL